MRYLPNSLRSRLIIRLAKPFTLVSPLRLLSLFELAQRIEKQRTPGDVVECGVYNGGSAAVLAHVATASKMKRTIWLFDSFEGMPGPTPEDGEDALAYAGGVKGDPEKVKAALKRVGADMRCIRIVKGWYRESFKNVHIKEIALLNLDADWYESVKLCLERFYDHVVKGGFVSIDDYGHWAGCRRALDEFFETKHISYPLNEVDYTARWFQKL